MGGSSSQSPLQCIDGEGLDYIQYILFLCFEKYWLDFVKVVFLMYEWAETTSTRNARFTVVGVFVVVLFGLSVWGVNIVPYLIVAGAGLPPYCIYMHIPGSTHAKAPAGKKRRAYNN